MYRARGEANIEKIRQDIIVGALAEFAVSKYLNSISIKCSEPDLKLYKKSQKSFAADLLTDSSHFHVKSQSVESAARYGASWMFQKEDKLLSTPSETGKIVFCLVEGTKVHIKAIVSVLELVEADLIKKPKVFKYQFTKNALYLEDILNSKINLWSL